jgi:NDP-sugar pyrophosphorylase family protein
MSIRSRKTFGLLVLAGGKGTRLHAQLHGRPKALIQLPPWRPVLLDLIARANRQGAEVCLALDSRSYSAIESYLREHGQLTQLSIDSGRGTADAIRTALERMESSVVVVCNADTIIPFNLLEFAAQSSPPFLPVQQILTPTSVQNSGLIGIRGGGDRKYVIHWGEGAGCSAPGATTQWASSSGGYIIRRRQWLDYVDSDADSLEHEVMPSLVSDGIVEAHVVPTLLPTYDFGTPERIRNLQLNRVLLNRLIRASGADHPVIAGGCLPGIRIA